jgi:hypothetical protein
VSWRSNANTGPLSDRQVHYRLLGPNAPLIHASKPESRYVNNRVLTTSNRKPPLRRSDAITKVSLSRFSIEAPKF